MNKYELLALLITCMFCLNAGPARADGSFYYKDKSFPVTISSERIVIQLDSSRITMAGDDFLSRTHPKNRILGGIESAGQVTSPMKTGLANCVPERRK